MSGTARLAENEPLRATAEVRVAGNALEPCQPSANSPAPLGAVSNPRLAKALTPGGAATVKSMDKVGAAAKVALPAWLASTLHAPAATSASVVPLTVQTLCVVEAKETVKPDEAVADSAGDAVPTVGLAGAVKVTVMVCACKGAGATVMVLDTVAAAAKLVLPTWVALIVQLPALSKARLVPLTVQTVVVAADSVTAKPELDDATKAGVAVPSA